jgi:hypothetical protein
LRLAVALLRLAKTQMTQELPTVIRDFSLVRGGPFLKLLRLLRLATPSSGLGPRSAVFFCILTWLPLLALSAMHGAAIGDGVRIPYLMDIPAAVRFLLAIPLMIVAERLINARVGDALKHLVRSGLVPDHSASAVESIVRTAQRLSDSALAELAGVAVVIVGTAYLRIEMSGSISSWQFVAGAEGATRTLAGWWYILISLPIFQFLFYRWIWRYVVWSWMLLRISRLDLRLIPIHPDRSAGLSVFGLTQVSFGILAIAASSVISAEYAEEFLLGATTITQSGPTIFGYVVLGFAILLGPLFVFSSALFRVQWKGLLDYGALADRYTLGFSRKWITGEAPAEEPLLGSADIQSLADLANSYGIIREMQIAPLDVRTVVLPILACIVVPLLPAVLAVVPIDQIAREIMLRLF